MSLVLDLLAGLYRLGGSVSTTERYVTAKDVKPGSIWRRSRYTVVVLAVGDGHVVLRYAGEHNQRHALPMGNFLARYTLVGS